VDYFLIVWDYVNYAKVNRLAVGPGRGSAAGSLVSYTLTITDIDPMKYDLLFERFLNPERVTMPDIDVDFCDEGRQKVIDYVIEKYGKDCVSQIITFGTMAARAAIKDVGRVIDLPYAMVDNIAKMVPRELNITLDKALKENPDLKSLYDSDPQVKNLIDMSKKLEGLPRHASIHASGVLISGKPVGEYVPLSVGADGETVAQFEKDTLEELGLLKMDFLGLRTETVISDTENLVRQKNPDFTVDNISYEDPNVYDLISSGKCDGIFQLESAGMKNFMKELKPTCLDDVIAGISLYRPGPMEYIPQYIEGKNNKDNITYDCPQLEPILKPTYGVIVYQEQVMQIVRDLAGYSLGRADLVRRAMAKKKLKVMEEERQNFIYGNESAGVPGCVKNGVSAEVGNAIFDKMISFAAYAFNKSHAAGYAVVCYQTAYLKCYYPVEYMSALLTSVIDNTSKVEGYIYACRQMNINILPPDVNRSQDGFTNENGDIRFGLNAIKALGRPTIEAIIRNREAMGEFKSIQDVAARMHKELNKRTFENLIKAGALDSLGANRRQMMCTYAQILDNAERKGKDDVTGQMSLFDVVDDEAKADFEIKLPPLDEYNKEEKLEYEKDVLGVYVSGHPLDEYMGMWKKHVSANSTDFEIDQELGETRVADNSRQTIGGMIMNRKVMTTKRGELMAFLTIEDLFGTVEVIVFPKSYSDNRDAIDNNDKVFITGKVQANADENGKLICDRVTPFSEVVRTLWIRLADEASYAGVEGELTEAMKDLDGKDKVIIYCEKEKSRIKWGANRNICITPQLLEMLKKRFGDRNVETT
jgi:DNA polymerase-3 subunit alpha